MVRIQLLSQGSRVTVGRGHFPIDPSLLGRIGTVIHRLRNSSMKYGVQLDGEVQIRVFTEDELEINV